MKNRNKSELNSMKKFILMIVALSLLFPAYAQGRGGKQVKQKVKVGKVFKEQNIESRKVVGFAKDISRVDLTTRISADLIKVGFHDGDLVKKGQMLYQFDDIRYAAAVKNAEAKLAEVKARLIYAESNYKRTNELYVKNAASKDSMETTRSTLDACRAELLAAEASLVTAQDDLKHTRIYAPISGRIGATNYTVGNYLTPSSGVLATIIQSRPIRVVFSMSNRDYANMFGGREEQLKKEALIRVRLANGDYYDENGTVEFINNEANQRTDTIQVYSRFENKVGRLIPNNAVTVELSHKIGKPVAAVLPSAVMHDADSPYVYVVKDNKIERRNVELGRTTGAAQLITRGLAEGELVVTDGTHKVLPGSEIIPDYGTGKVKNDGVK